MKIFSAKDDYDIVMSPLKEGIDFYYTFHFVFKGDKLYFVLADTYEKDYSNHSCKSKKWNRYNRLRKSLKPFWDTNKPESLEERVEELIKDKEEIEKELKED